MSERPPHPEPPSIYDIRIDQRRLVTEADVEKWVRLEQAYGRMVTFLREEHQKLMDSLKA